MRLEGRNKSEKKKKITYMKVDYSKKSLGLQGGQRELPQVFGLHGGCLPGTPNYSLGAQP